MENNNPPPELLEAVGPQRDFLVRAKRLSPPAMSLLFAIPGILIIIVSINSAIPLIPKVMTGGIELTEGRLFFIMSLLFYLLPLFLGLRVLKVGITLLTKEGGYFTSNNSKLVYCIDKNISSVSWKDVIDVTFKGKNDYTTIVISVTNNTVVNTSQNLPNTSTIVMYGIKNGIMIAEKCKRRMIESKQIN